MAKGIVIVGYEGKDIPQEYRDRVAKRELRCLGIAMVKDGQIIVERRNGSIDAEGIKQIQDAIKEEKVFHLGEYPVSFNLSDMQPFVLATNKDEEPILVAFLEGDFSNSLKKNSSHLDVWHAAVEGIQPTVEQLHRLCKGNIDDIVKELKDEAVASKIESLITSTGSVTFLAVNGDIWSHSRGKQLHEFDWGAVSETLGLDKKKDEPKDSKSMLGSLLGKVSGLGVPITPNHKAQPDQAKPPKVVTATVDVPVVNGLKQYPEEKDGGPKRTDMSHLKTVEVKAAYKAYRRLLNMKELPGHIVAGIKAQQFPAIVSSQDGKWWEEQQKAKRAMGTEAIVAAVKSLPAAVSGTKSSTAPEREYTIEELMEQEEAEAAAAAKASETAVVFSPVRRGEADPRRDQRGRQGGGDRLARAPARPLQRSKREIGEQDREARVDEVGRAMGRGREGDDRRQAGEGQPHRRRERDAPRQDAGHDDDDQNERRDDARRRGLVVHRRGERRELRARPGEARIDRRREAAQREPRQQTGERDEEPRRPTAARFAGARRRLIKRDQQRQRGEGGEVAEEQDDRDGVEQRQAQPQPAPVDRQPGGEGDQGEAHADGEVEQPERDGEVVGERRNEQHRGLRRAVDRLADPPGAPGGQDDRRRPGERDHAIGRKDRRQREAGEVDGEVGDRRQPHLVERGERIARRHVEQRQPRPVVDQVEARRNRPDSERGERQRDERAVNEAEPALPQRRRGRRGVRSPPHQRGDRHWASRFENGVRLAWTSGAVEARTMPSAGERSLARRRRATRAARASGACASSAPGAVPPLCRSPGRSSTPRRRRSESPKSAARPNRAGARCIQFEQQCDNPLSPLAGRGRG